LYPLFGARVIVYEGEYDRGPFNRGGGTGVVTLNK